jgi:hypothetical protein
MKTTMEFTRSNKTAFIPYDDEIELKELAEETLDIYKLNYTRIRNNYYIYHFEQAAKYGETIGNMYAARKASMADKVINELERFISSINYIPDKKTKNEAFFALTFLRGILDNENDPSLYYSLQTYDYAVLLRINDYIDFKRNMNNPELHSIQKAKKGFIVLKDLYKEHIAGL